MQHCQRMDSPFFCQLRTEIAKTTYLLCFCTSFQHVIQDALKTELPNLSSGCIKSVPPASVPSLLRPSNKTREILTPSSHPGHSKHF